MTESPGEERELTPEEKAAEVERLAEIDRRLEEQADGSIKITLRDPVSTGPDTQRTTLVAVPANAGHIRRAQKAIRVNQDGVNYAFADQLIKPEGLWEEIRRNDDLELVKEAVDRQLGKFNPGPAGNSGSSE
ncbi:MAG: hypothetical protein JJ863_21365 [Deltaproteobacteria bacterium]|nr:hypothetical protein [Deltaproteobacteria bacterium]